MTDAAGNTTRGSNEDAPLLNDERNRYDGETHGDQPQYRTYPMRWLALAQLCMINCGNAAQWIVFGMVVTQAKSDFDLTTTQVNLLSASYEIVFALTAPIVLYVYDRMGLRAGMRWASAFNFAGCLMRFVATLWWPSFGGMFVSQCLLSVTIVFIFPSPPVLAAKWFSDEERTLATTIGAVSNTLGLAVGQLIPPLIVTPDNHSQERWLLLFAVQGSYSIFEAFLILFVIPEGPKTPPSAAEAVRAPSNAAAQLAKAEHHHHHRHKGAPAYQEDDTDVAFSSPLYSDSDDSETSAHLRASRRVSSTVASQLVHHPSVAAQLRNAFRTPAFAMLFVAAGLFFGCQWSIIGLISQLMEPMGISEATAGWMGFTQILVGSAFAIPFSAWVDRVRRYKVPLVGMLIACTLLYNLFTTAVAYGGERLLPLSFAVYVLLGLPQSCAIPIIMEYAVELTYPLDETVATFAVIWCANVFSVPMLFILPAIIGDPAAKGTAQIALYCLGLASFASTLLILLPKPHLKRLEYERATKDLEGNKEQ